MSPHHLRNAGIFFMVFAAVLAVINLTRVADAGTFWLVPPFVIIGSALLIRARRRTAR